MGPPLAQTTPMSVRPRGVTQRHHKTRQGVRALAMDTHSGAFSGSQRGKSRTDTCKEVALFFSQPEVSHGTDTFKEVAPSFFSQPEVSHGTDTCKEVAPSFFSQPEVSHGTDTCKEVAPSFFSQPEVSYGKDTCKEVAPSFFSQPEVSHGTDTCKEVTPSFSSQPEPEVSHGTDTCKEVAPSFFSQPEPEVSHGTDTCKEVALSFFSQPEVSHRTDTCKEVAPSFFSQPEPEVSHRTDTCKEVAPSFFSSQPEPEVSHGTDTCKEVAPSFFSQPEVSHRTDTCKEVAPSFFSSQPEAEVLKDYRSLIETVRNTPPEASIIVSGLLPMYRQGQERRDLGCIVLMVFTPAESERLFCRTTSPRRYTPDDYDGCGETILPEDAIISGFIHFGTDTTSWITQRKTRARTRARTSPPPLLVFEISTRNRFSHLRESERDDAVIIGTSMVRHVRATSGKGKVCTHCFPGAHVLDVATQVPEILNGDECVGAVVLNVGANDIRPSF
ncbi:hypothetical protein F2P79_004992 [Pimephales promelas]|nr:hypothetical protein F2P79_004992 [Pimephales promelas]